MPSDADGLAPAGFEHGMVAATLGARLTAFAVAHHLGVVLAAETGFALARDPGARVVAHPRPRLGT